MTIFFPVVMGITAKAVTIILRTKIKKSGNNNASNQDEDSELMELNKFT